MRIHKLEEVGSPGGIPTKEEILRGSRTNSAQFRNPQVQRNYIIPVLSKALVIMDLLRRSDTPLNIAEIADRTETSKSTTYRILRTLSAFGYLPDGSEGVYSFKRRERL